MSPERWSEIKRIFNEAVDLAPTEQRLFLDSACADDELRREVEQMLAADAEPLLTESPLIAFAEDEAASLKDKRIGCYRILHEVGRGGMGTVFAAVRDDGEFEQQVAIKIIKRGLSTQT